MQTKRERIPFLANTDPYFTDSFLLCHTTMRRQRYSDETGVALTALKKPQQQQSRPSMVPEDMEELVRGRGGDDDDNFHNAYRIQNDSDDDDDDDDYRKPLVVGPTIYLLSTPARNRRTTKDMSAWSTRDEDIATSYCSDGFKILASVFLAALLLSPLAYNYYHKNQQQQEPNEKQSWLDFLPTDQQIHRQACGPSMHLSLTHLYDVLTATDVNNCNPRNLSNHKSRAACRCYSPLVPIDRVRSQPQYWDAWDQTLDRNQRSIGRLSNESLASLRVVFVGDSITEHWQGTDLSTPIGGGVQYRNVFQQLFPHGLALGVAGDRVSHYIYKDSPNCWSVFVWCHDSHTIVAKTPQLLYRMQRDKELSDLLHPKVWWVLIGTNDLADDCDPATIVMGILRIALELRFQRPEATIVINSILPRPDPNFVWPNSPVYAPIVYMNQHLECIVESMQDDQIRYFDATSLFLEKDGRTVPRDLMPDELHPSVEGARVWGKAMANVIEQYSNTGTSAPGTP